MPRGALLSALCCQLLVGCGDDATSRPCTADSDCKLPELCTEGRCTAPDPAAEGQPCSHPAHCDSGLCHDGTGKGGICATPCTSPSDCADDQVCVPVTGQSLPLPADGSKPAPQLMLLCQAAGAGPRHLGEPCESDADCSTGLCQPDRCTVPCPSDGGWSCPGSLVCEADTLSSGGASLATGLCQRKLLRTLELGAVDVPAGGMSSPLTFDIDAGVESFLVMADDTDNLRVALPRLEAPDGTVLVSYTDPASAQMYAFDYLGTGTVQVPGTDNPKGAVQTGTYKLWVQTYDPPASPLTPKAGRVERVAVLLRNSAQKGGLLDLDLHFAPATGLTAAAAPSDPFVTAALAQLKSIYNLRLGIGLGRVRYFDLPAAWDTVKDWDAVVKLRVDHSQAGPNGLTASVFVVKDLGIPYLGVAGGIPGVPGLVGRPISGTVVVKQSDAKKMGRLLAHELGHFLGLFHTTENGAAGYDKISDTPQCASGTQVADCPDYHYVMFPFYLNAPDPMLFSRGQALVVRGSPFLYEEAYPEACGPGTEVVDVSLSGFGGGTTRGQSPRLSSACGGAGQGERVHLYRVNASGLKSLDVEAHGIDFAPVVYVLRDACDGTGTELACQSGKKGEAVKLSISAPQAGPHYVVVDSDSGSGAFSLKVTPVSP